MESIQKDSEDHVKAFLNGGGSFMIGNYCAKKKKIGMGTFATIYHAIEMDLGREVAIKTIRVPDVKRLADNITREIKIMKELKHSNIVRLYDIIYDKDLDNVHLVMEYAPLGNLADFQKKSGPVGEIYAKVYMRQLAKGLQYLLNNGIVHRDLKPQNILMFGKYNIKLADFGFARSFGNEDDMFNTFCGSPLYMAPELLLPSKSKSKKYNSKADLWSVGIILYELLTGKVPSYSKSVPQLSRKLRDNDFKLPASIKVTPECRDLIDRLLIKDPVKRIEWEEFFNHKWFDRDEILERDNKLIQMAEEAIAGGPFQPPRAEQEDLQSSVELLKKFSFTRSSIHDERLPTARPKQKLADLHSSFQEMKKSLYSKPKKSPPVSIPKSSPLLSEDKLSMSPDLLTLSDIQMAQRVCPVNPEIEQDLKEAFKESGTDVNVSVDKDKTESLETLELYQDPVDYESDEEDPNELFFSCEIEIPRTETIVRTPTITESPVESPKSNIPIEHSQITNLLDTELSQKLDEVMTQLNEIWKRKKVIEKTESKVSQSVAETYDPELSFGKIMQGSSDSVDQEYQMVNMLSFHENHFGSQSKEDEPETDPDDIILDERGKYVVISTNPVNIRAQSDIIANRAQYQNGFRYYLDNSINFLKESYTYFANNRKSI